MADKSINELPAATSIQPADLFVLQQQATNSARSLEGQVLVSWLTNYADGHGGIQSIAKTSTSGLVDTYTISYADGSTGTFTVTNGATGPTGAAAYVWIKWAAQEPTADNQMSNNPDAWIGIYTGTASSAPTSYTSYTWYQYKGDKGDTGDGISSVVQTGGTGAPGTTDTYTMYVGETAVGTFDVYNGLNGTGAVNSVNNLLPDGTGNVVLSASDVGAASIVSLWTNSSPSSAFASQTVTLDLSGYDAVLIEFALSAGSTPSGARIYFKGHGTYLDYMPWPNGTNINLVGRTVEVTAANVVFGPGLAMAQGSAQADVNNRFVPLYIYGLKGIN